MILLVDDEAADLRLYSLLLKDAGYPIVTALNGQEALAALDNGERFVLIFMDIIMPDLSGIAVAAQIRALPPPVCDIPIVAITGYNIDMHRDAPLIEAARFSEVLQKPLGSRDLLASVIRWAGKPQR